VQKGTPKEENGPTMLQVDKSIISRDMAHLRHEAQENLQKHIHETIPEEYQKAMTSIDQILKMCWSIINKTADEKTKLQALALINECTKHKVDLSTNGVVITDAIKYVSGKMDHLNTAEKNLLQDIKEDGDAEAEAPDNGEEPEISQQAQEHEGDARDLDEGKTTNTIF
jgi:hypothetical protein